MTTRDVPDDRNALLCPSPPAPLLYPVLALMGGILLSDALGPVNRPWHQPLFLLPLAPAAALASPAVRRGRFAGTAVIGLLALCIGFARHQAVIYRPPNHVLHVLPDAPVLTRLAGRVVTSPVQRAALRLNPFLPFDPQPRTQFVLALQELRTITPPAPIVGTIRVNVEGARLDLPLGAQIELTGKLYRPLRPRNPGEQDWSRWYAQQGLDAGLLVEGPEYVRLLPQPPAWTARLITGLRAAAHNLLFEPWASLDDDPAVRLLDTMVLGHRSAADRSINEAFLRAGGMHFLAVSGFNVSLLAATAWWLARRLLRRSLLTAALSALTLVLAFALLAEPNAPVLRATAATVLATLAALLRRPVCFMNWLAASAGFVLLLNPLELLRPGFQLSFGLVLALVRLVPRTLGWPHYDVVPVTPRPETLRSVLIRKAGHAAATLVMSCLIAWVVSLPLVLWHFQRLAPWGWLGTLLLTPLVTAITLLSFFTMLTSAVLPVVGAAPATALHGCTALLLKIVGAFEHLPAAVITTPRPPLWLVLTTYAILIAFDQALRRPPHQDLPTTITAGTPNRKPFATLPRPFILGASSTVVVVLWLGWLFWPTPPDTPHGALHILAVGNGTACVLTTADRRAAVLDVGTDTNSDAGEVVCDALRALDVRRPVLTLISHANFDHYSGLPTLLARFPGTRWATNAELAARLQNSPPALPLAELLPPAHRPPTVLKSGDTLHLGNVTIEVLWPPGDIQPDGNANDRSLVLRVWLGPRSVLLTGDIERAALSSLVDAAREGQLHLAADALVAPHHGQVIPGVTAAFYQAVRPQVVIASTRTPRPRLARLVTDVLGPGVPVFETGRCGTVTLSVTPAGQLRAETPFAPQPDDRHLDALVHPEEEPSQD